MRRAKNGRGTAILIMAAMLAASCAGCGSSSNSTKKIVSAASTANESTQDDTAVEVQSTAAQSETSAPAETTDTAAADNGGATSIDEQVLMNAEGVVITATGYEEGGLVGDELKLLIENNGSSDVGVGCDALIVNDYMITDLFSETVAAGKKSNESLDLMSSELKSAGIENVGQIEIYFHLFNPDTYETTYTADPAVIRTNKYDQMDTEPNDDGHELYNANGYRIVGKYVDEDSIWGNAIVLYLENNTDQNVIFQCDNLSVNGFMMTPYFSSTVYAHKRAIDDITLMSSELEENGIESVSDVDVTFRIVNADTYETILETDPIQFSAS